MNGKEEKKLKKVKMEQKQNLFLKSQKIFLKFMGIISFIQMITEIILII